MADQYTIDLTSIKLSGRGHLGPLHQNGRPIDPATVEQTKPPAFYQLLIGEQEPGRWSAALVINGVSHVNLPLTIDAKDAPQALEAARKVLTELVAQLPKRL